MLSNKFNEALVWAASLHQTQQRKTNNTPYIAHLLSVSALVIEHGGNEEQAIAALLHDVIEDQGVTPAEITSKFGQKVADLVEAVTESYTRPKPDWNTCKELYLTKISQSSPEAVFVSLADKLHNARSLEEAIYHHGDTMWDKFFHGRKSQTYHFYQKLVEIYHLKGFSDNLLLIELEKIIGRIFGQL